MSNPRTIPVAILVVLWAGAVSAQSTPSRSIEIGAGLGGVMSWWGVATPGGDVRVTIPTSDRFAVEALIGRAPREGGVTRGLYGGQIKQTVRKWQSADVEPFLTYGLIGVFERYHLDEYQYTSATGKVTVSQAVTYSYVYPPLIGLIGGGVQRRVAAHLAVRFEAQAVMALILPVGVRVAAGVSVPLGGR